MGVKKVPVKRRAQTGPLIRDPEQTLKSHAVSREIGAETRKGFQELGQVLAAPRPSQKSG